MGTNEGVPNEVFQTTRRGLDRSRARCRNRLRVRAVDPDDHDANFDRYGHFAGDEGQFDASEHSSPGHQYDRNDAFIGQQRDAVELHWPEQLGDAAVGWRDGCRYRIRAAAQS
jgi:hypothetical protein